MTFRFQYRHQSSHKFPSKYCYSSIPQIWYVVFTFSISLTNQFRCYLLTKCLQVLQLFLLLNSNLIPFWSDSMLYMTWILLNVLRLILQPRIWSIMWNVPCVVEKKKCIQLLLSVMVYKCELGQVGWYCCSNPPYPSHVYLLILAIIDRGVLKSPTIMGFVYFPLQFR